MKVYRQYKEYEGLSEMVDMIVRDNTGVNDLSRIEYKNDEVYPDEGLRMFDVYLYGKLVGIVSIYSNDEYNDINYKKVKYEAIKEE